jgi:hypothetical protein
MYELANGATLGRTEFVLHRCDNRLCCNPAHLFVGTQRENIRDMMAKGRARFAGRSMVNRDAVARMIAAGMTQYEVAAAVGCSQATVCRIAAEFGASPGRGFRKSAAARRTLFGRIAYL